MKTAKKWMSLALTVVMLMTCVPAEIFAAPAPRVFTSFEELFTSGLVTTKSLVPTPVQVIPVTGKESFLTSVPQHRGIKGSYGKEGYMALLPDGSRTWLGAGDIDWRFTSKEIGEDFGLRTGSAAKDMPKGWVRLKATEETVARVNSPVKVRITEPAMMDGGVVRVTKEIEFKAGEIIEYNAATREWASATYPEFFMRKGGYNLEKIMADAPGLTQRELADILQYGDQSLFSRTDRFAKFSRIQAEPAKAGEVVETILKDGTKETVGVAKAGDMIVTNPGGERYIVSGEKFAKRYEAAADLGKGWFKPKGAVQDFRVISRDMIIVAPWGEKQILKEGASLNVTNIKNYANPDIYGVAKGEFADTYKTVRAMYQENLKGIRALVAKIETKMQAKIAGYNGLFFRRMLANDTKFMERKLEQASARRAERLAMEEAARKGAQRRALNHAALRRFGGIFLGVGLVAVLTFTSIPGAQAANVNVRAKSETIAQVAAEAESLQDDNTLTTFEQMQVYANPANEAAILGNPALLEKMGTYIPTIKAAGLMELDDNGKPVVDTNGNPVFEAASSVIADQLQEDLDEFEKEQLKSRLCVGGRCEVANW